MEHQPRGRSVVASRKPTETERGQWYFQRYVQHLPTAGEIGSVRPFLVQPGRRRARDGLLLPRRIFEFMRQTPEFERHLVRSGVHLIKFWFSVSREDSAAASRNAKAHPLKQ